MLATTYIPSPLKGLLQPHFSWIIPLLSGNHGYFHTETPEFPVCFY